MIETLIIIILALANIYLIYKLLQKEKEVKSMQEKRFLFLNEVTQVLAHQWKQPVSALSMLNEVVISGYKKGFLDDKLMEYFKTNSKKQIETLISLIDEFRDFFTQTKKEEISLDLILKEATKQFDNIKIKELLPTTITTYKEPLKRALFNIINSIASVSDECEISLSKNKITIKSNSDLSSLFMPYFSLKDKETKKHNLYIEKKVLEEIIGAKVEVNKNLIKIILKTS